MRPQAPTDLYVRLRHIRRLYCTTPPAGCQGRFRPVQLPLCRRRHGGGEDEQCERESGSGSLMKNLKLDDMLESARGKEIDDKAIETIYNTIKPYENNGDFYISEVSITPIAPNKEGSIPKL